MEKDLTKVSRTISHALRHEPWLYELELDEAGWTPVEDLLAALREERHEWRDLSVADLVEIIEKADKQRFELHDGKIRAIYGHTVPGKIVQVEAEPPDILFHGTSSAARVAIQAEGLKPMGRQYVHLSADWETAKQVGQRKKGRLIVLWVQAGEAYHHGVKFYQGNDKVWLADFVPPQFIRE